MALTLLASIFLFISVLLLFFSTCLLLFLSVRLVLRIHLRRLDSSFQCFGVSLASFINVDSDLIPGTILQYVLQLANTRALSSYLVDVCLHHNTCLFFLKVIGVKVYLVIFDFGGITHYLLIPNQSSRFHC